MAISITLINHYLYSAVRLNFVISLILLPVAILVLVIKSVD